MPANKHWYQLAPADLFAALGSRPEGLSEEEAARRLARTGPNRLTARSKVSALTILLSQFQNSLIIILLLAAALILFIWYFGDREQSDLIEAVLIVAIVLLITVLGFLQEWKAEKAIEALKKLLAYKAKVRRGGLEREVEVWQLVPGDLVILEEGARVPADLRLLTVANLTTNEAPLTGESVPVVKTTAPLPKDDLPVADRTNMAFSGTSVASGRGLGIVVATGDRTELGQIASSVAETPEEETFLQKNLDRVGRMLGWLVLGIAGVVFVFIAFLAADFSREPLLTRILHSFIAAVALAVAAIPEGLPAVVTISLALGTQRMLKRNVLVRRLASVETLGSTDTICADKTGTLTRGEMMVKAMVVGNDRIEVTGSGYQTNGEFWQDGRVVDPRRLSLIMKVGLLCNNASLQPDGTVTGDPTEAALLVAAAKATASAALAPKARRLSEIPFSSERKMMSVIVEEEGERYVFTKGAPEVVLERCRRILIEGRAVPLSASRKAAVLAETEALSKQALRTLGVAYKPLRADSTEEPEAGLIFVGLFGLIDPPRTEIKPLIAKLSRSGIRVIMITGDHAATAEAVAREVGILGKTVTGEQLVRMSDEDLSRAVEEVGIFARVNPSAKTRIVAALKRHGHIVAMTGDGVNDAPALKAADIGIAMGLTGTDVAKEAADMVLLDDHFRSIVAAVEEGRSIFLNIKKFVNYLLSCNIGEVMTIFVGVLLFRDVLLTATMLLWINIVTDGLPAIALGLDPAGPDILRDPPRRFQGDILRRSDWLEMGLFGLLLALGIVGLYFLNLPEGTGEARGVAFLAIVVLELVRLFHIRTAHKTPLLANRWLLVAVLTSVLLQLAIVYLPLPARLFGVSPIDGIDWVMLLLLAILLWIGFDNLARLLHRRRIVADSP